MEVLYILSFLNDTLYDAAPYALVCLSFVLTAKYIRFPDLTCSGSFVLGGAIAATSIVKGGIAPLPACILALVAGAFAGCVTGFFYTVLKIDRLLSGILSAFLLYSVNLLILTPTLAYSSHPTLLTTFERLDREILALNVSWHPYVILLLLAITILTKVVLDWFLASEAGLALRALEDEVAGEHALQRGGISASSLRMFALIVGNAIVGLSGALVSFKEGAANADRGFDLLITALVAFLLGVQVGKLLSTVLSRILHHRVRLKPTTSAILGVGVYFLLVTFSQRASIPAAYTKILLVTLVVLSIAQPSLKLRRTVHQKLCSAGTESPNTLLSVRDLRYRYPSADSDSLVGLSFDLHKNEIVRLVGGNGTGKTTTLKLIAGLLNASCGGRICMSGEDVTATAEGRLTKVGYIDQNAERGVVGTLSVMENLTIAAFGGQPSFWRRAIGAQNRTHLEDVVRLGQLPPDLVHKIAENLSGGQRQAVNVLTLAARKETPAVALLDEPTNNLDPANTDRCRLVIERLHHRGAAILFVSHASLPGMEIDRQIDLGETKSGISRDDVNSPAARSTQ